MKNLSTSPIQAIRIKDLLDEVEIEHRTTQRRIVQRLYEMGRQRLNDPETLAWTRQLVHRGPEAIRLLGTIRQHAADLPAFFAPMSAACREKFFEIALANPHMTAQLLDELLTAKQTRPGCYDAWAELHGWPKLTPRRQRTA